MSVFISDSQTTYSGKSVKMYTEYDAARELLILEND